MSPRQGKGWLITKVAVQYKSAYPPCMHMEAALLVFQPLFASQLIQQLSYLLRRSLGSGAPRMIS